MLSRQSSSEATVMESFFRVRVNCIFRVPGKYPMGHLAASQAIFRVMHSKLPTANLISGRVTRELFFDSGAIIDLFEEALNRYHSKVNQLCFLVSDTCSVNGSIFRMVELPLIDCKSYT
jgi:hypothetical protein